MFRGEVWWVNFDPSLGGEIRKTRPALIVSNDISNKFLNRVQVIPLTSQIKKCYPSEAYVMVNGKKAKAMADQIMTVSKLRLINKEGSAGSKDLNAVNRAIQLQLGLK